MRAGSGLAIVYAIIWIIFFLCLCKNFKKNITSIFITIFYVIYSILAIFLYNNNDFGIGYNSLTLFPYLYLFVMIYLSMTPIISYDHSNIKGLIRPSSPLIDTFTYTFIILALISLPSTISELRTGIVLLIVDSSGGADLYKDAHGGGLESKGIAAIPKYLFSIFSYISIIIFFYYLTLPKPKKFVLIGLIITMVYNLLRPLSLGLRTDTVMAIFAFMAAYIIMYKWIPKRRNKILLTLASIVGGIVISLMLILSISRFGDRAGGVGGTNLDYIAQASLNFNNYGLDAGGIRYGDRTCRVFKEMVGFSDVPNGIIERRQKYHSMKMNDSIFYTFVGDFTLDFGPIVTVILFILYALILIQLTKCKRNGVISFSKLILVYLAVLIPLQGGMYLFTFSDGGNYSLLAFAFTSIVFKLKKNYKKKIVWTK